MVSTDPLVWLSIAWMVAGVSFLFKDNFLYRTAETCLIGVLIGHGINTALLSLRSQIIIPISTNGDFLAIIAVAIGLLTYARFVKPTFAWLGRYPTSVMYGLGAGIALTSMIKGFIIAVILNYAAMDFGIPWIIAMGGTIGILMYFVFVREHTGPWGIMARIGSSIMFMGVVGYHAAIYFYKSQPNAIERWGYFLRTALGVIK